MFAVFKTGGKQYKAVKNDVLKLEKVEGEKGSVIIFDQILAYGDDKGKMTLGTPLVKDIKISAEVIGQGKDDKVIVFKKKRRHNYRRKRGHRQQTTWVRINDIGSNPSTALSAPEKKESVKKEAKPEAKKEAPKAQKKTEATKSATTKTKASAKKTEAKKATAKKSTAKKTTTKKK